MSCACSAVLSRGLPSPTTDGVSARRAPDRNVSKEVAKVLKVRVLRRVMMVKGYHDHGFDAENSENKDCCVK